MPPSHFGIDACPKCGTAPDWSEWRGRIWCPTCEVDYEPADWGVLDGPVPVELYALMGFDLRTRRVAVENSEESSA